MGDIFVTPVSRQIGQLFTEFLCGLLERSRHPGGSIRVWDGDDSAVLPERAPDVDKSVLFKVPEVSLDGAY
jgi:aminoglycoside N3'-acetyltransferase